MQNLIKNVMSTMQPDEVVITPTIIDINMHVTSSLDEDGNTIFTFDTIRFSGENYYAEYVDYKNSMANIDRDEMSIDSIITQQDILLSLQV